MKINAIIIEDEPLAREKLIGYIGKVTFLNLVASFPNAMSALEFLEENSIDLIFLDIKMNQLNGIEFLNLQSSKAKIIITTAYEQYAISGYEHQVSDFLLKPFGFDRFLKAVLNLSRDKEQLTKEPEFIFIKTEYRIERIDLNDIFFIEGMKDYLSIATVNAKIKTLMSFGEIIHLLPAYRFPRVHKSFIVALDKIKSIEKAIITTDKGFFPISDTYKSAFFQLLKDKNHII